MKDHILIHTGEKLHKCDICELSFTQSSTLNKHKRIHSAEKLHNCEFCGKSFANSISYHKRICTKENPYKCEFCEKTYHKNSKLMGHMKLAHREKLNNSRLTDKQQASSKNKSSQINDNRISSESKPSKKMDVEICNDYLPNKTTDNLDKRNSISDESNISKTAKEPIETYLCLYCNKHIDTGEKLREHKHCSKKNQGSFSCLVCNETFTRKLNLLNHEKIHTIHKTSTCESCNKAFNNEYAYVLHMRSVHKESIQEKESSNNFANIPENITDNQLIKTVDQEAEIKVEIDAEIVEAIEEEERYDNCQMQKIRVTIPGREKRLADSAYAMMLRSDIN